MNMDCHIPVPSIRRCSRCKPESRDQSSCRSHVLSNPAHQDSLAHHNHHRSIQGSRSKDARRCYNHHDLCSPHPPQDTRVSGTLLRANQDHIHIGRLGIFRGPCIHYRSPFQSSMARRHTPHYPSAPGCLVHMVHYSLLPSSL